MKVFKNLFNGKGHIDGITIISSSGEILFTAKFNNKLNDVAEENYEVVGKNFFDIYENLSPETSSTYKSMELGVPLYSENQTLKSKGRKDILISSLSIPIKSGNKFVGAIDLSVSEVDVSKDADSIEIDSKMFEKNKVDALEEKTGKANYFTEDIITNNSKMREIKEYIDVVANCDLPVMLYGETGTGKELFAQSIHNASPRKKQAFISQNCAAIPENLLESTLFGTAKGAFTGAIDNVGLLELADKGTLFLDEVNSMPMHLQSKLLRVLQDGSFRSVGAKKDKKVDVKIISATNTEPIKAIEEGSIRRDLFYRLSIMNINIPPLRERKDDIPILVNFNISKYNEIFGKNIKYVSNKLYQKLTAYDWPGNIRELESIIVYGLSRVSSDKEKLQYSDIEQKFEEFTLLSTNKSPRSLILKDAIEDYEKSLIENALIESEYNIAQAARSLHVPRQTLQRKVKFYNLG